MPLYTSTSYRTYSHNATVNGRFNVLVTGDVVRRETAVFRVETTAHIQGRDGQLSIPAAPMKPRHIPDRRIYHNGARAY